MDAARHYATAITLLRGADAGPAVDPATLVGMDVPSLVELNDVRRLCCPLHCAAKKCILPLQLLLKGTEVGSWVGTFMPDRCVHHHALWMDGYVGIVGCWPQRSFSAR